MSSEKDEYEYIKQASNALATLGVVLIGARRVSIDFLPLHLLIYFSSSIQAETLPSNTNINLIIPKGGKHNEKICFTCS